MLEPGIRIAALGPGQYLHIRAVAIHAMGRNHPKFMQFAAQRDLYDVQPRSRVPYAEALLCPESVFGLNDIEELVALNPQRCTNCGECRGTITKVEDRRTIIIRSKGDLTPAATLRKGVQALRKRYGHSS